MLCMAWSGPAGVVERWQPELDRLSPPTAHGPSHLMLDWEPGEAWAPVHRWVIRELTPAYRAPFDIYEQLRGPNPRDFGHYDAVSRRYVHTRSFLITRRQWEIYRATGFYAPMLWVVQGDRGGHKRFWSEVESNLSLLMGGPERPPLPGALPYAEPDFQTIARLRALGLVRLLSDTLRLQGNRVELGRKLDFIERNKAYEMGLRIWEWMEDQLGNALTLTRAQASEIWDYADPDAPEPDMDFGKEEFVKEIARTAVH